MIHGSPKHRCWEPKHSCPSMGPPKLSEKLKSISKFSFVTSWRRHKKWEHFTKNDKSLSKFYGQNSEYELKTDSIIQIDNCSGIPKHSSKSRLSLLIIDIITLKVKQYWPKTTKMGENTESERNDPCTWEAPNILIIDVYVHWCAQKIEYSKFVVREKIQSKDNSQNL